MTTTDQPTTACPSCGHNEVHSPLSGCLFAEGSAYCTCTARWAVPKTLAVARVERDTAMERVAAHTDPAWEAQAVAVIVRLSGNPGPFTVDDVWDALTALGVPSPREPRALGPVMKRAVRDRLLIPQGYVQSRRRHAAPVRAYIGAP